MRKETKIKLRRRIFSNGPSKQPSKGEGKYLENEKKGVLWLPQGCHQKNWELHLWPQKCCSSKSPTFNLSTETQPSRATRLPTTAPWPTSRVCCSSWTRPRARWRSFSKKGRSNWSSSSSSASLRGTPLMWVAGDGGLVHQAYLFQLYPTCSGKKEIE